MRHPAMFAVAIASVVMMCATPMSAQQSGAVERVGEATGVSNGVSTDPAASASTAATRVVRHRTERVREIAFEAFHRFVLTQWVALKPDVQFIKTPGGVPGRRTIVAGTVRIEVVF